jgi:carbonic anhydrase/acetyltransferase-like protein (isoleucine patch superfamily)
MGKIIERLEKGPSVGDRVFVAENATVLGDVYLDDDVSVWYSVIIRGDVDRIHVGKCSNVQDNAVIHVTTDKHPVYIGDFTTIGHAAALHGCTIGNNVLVGIGAIILDGAIVGDECIVAAGSLIPPGKTFPNRSMIMGHPAQVVKQLANEDINHIKEYALKYKEYKQIYIGNDKRYTDKIRTAINAKR